MKLSFAVSMALGLALQAGLAHALDIRFTPVARNVYAYIGDLGPRSVANEGLNANLGLVVTAEGALLIDSGATSESARKVEEAVRAITPLPIKWVINTGGQDHRWLGNSYFVKRGAVIYAHQSAVADMRARGGDQLGALRALLGAAAQGTSAQFPTVLLDKPDNTLVLGGVQVELRHRGGGHTPGDAMVWLPQSRVLFTGDIVYVDRLLAVLPVSDTKSWLLAFELVEQLAPDKIVPGHGPVTGLPAARAHTRSYLESLRAHMRAAVEKNLDIGDAVRSFDMTPYTRLLNAAELHPGNANRVYLELERE